MIKIKKLHKDAKIHERNNGDAGIDLSVVEMSTPFGEYPIDNINGLWRILGGAIYHAKIGISIELPENTFGLIKPRSGLSYKYGLNVLAGVVDRSYTGEIVVIFSTIGMFSLKRGDRIAQIVPVSIVEDKITEVDILSNSERGENGFGSSGR